MRFSRQGVEASTREYFLVKLTLGILLSIGLAGICHGRAQAITEFCPAALNVAPVATNGGAARTYGIELYAGSAREVGATVVFDTSRGWFDVKIPQTSLTKSYRSFPLMNQQQWRMSVYASNPFYVRFPSAVTLNNAFITHAQSWGDAFGWADRGEITCPLVGGMGSQANFGGTKRAPVGPELKVLSTPPSGASYLAAEARAPLEPDSCKKPYTQATAKHSVMPTYPDFSSTAGDNIANIAIELALNPDGSVTDAWVLAGSGDAALDKAALTAAETSTYTGATEYCHAAPSVYVFLITYQMWNNQ